jgi:hypothetical protein
MPLEIIVGPAIGAGAATPSVRKSVRKGLVFGVSGALILYDRVTRNTRSTVATGPGAASTAPVAAPDATPTSPAPTPAGDQKVPH